ncbi:MAG: hypothetical protein WA130_19665, partial [Candidatus Methanoperedens sp.]
GGGGGEPGPGPGPGPEPSPNPTPTVTPPGPGGNGTEQWNMTYGGPDFDAAYSVRSSGSGYVLAGSTNGDASMIFTDNSGNQLSNRTFGGPGFDKANQITSAQDGFVLAGLTSGVSQDAWLIKTDNTGNESWNKTYGGEGSEEATAVIRITGGATFILAGYTDSYGNGSADAWLVKTDSNGTIQWNKTFGGADNDSARAISQTQDGGFVIAGETYSYGAGNGDAWLIKTDANGSEQWSRTFGGTGFDAIYSVNLTQGGYILAGETRSYGDVNGDAWLIKTDMNGSEQWNRTYGGPDREYARSLKQAGTGFLLAGARYDGPTSNALLIRTDINGSEQYNRTYGGSENDIAYSIQANLDNSIILAGSTASYGSGSEDAWLIRIGGS